MIRFLFSFSFAVRFVPSPLFVYREYNELGEQLREGGLEVYGMVDEGIVLKNYLH